MKKYLLLFSFLLGTWATAVAQNYTTAEGRILLSGLVVNEAGEPMADVHIVNQFNRQVTITDASGFFTIYISKHHVLHFTSVGYETYVFRVDRDFEGDMLYKEVEMIVKPISLREFTVKDQEEEIETVVRVPEPEPTIDVGTLRGRTPVPVEPTLMSPISYFYEIFGNKPQQRRKVQELLRQQRLDSIAYARLSGEKVWEMTGLFGERLVEFKEFCNLPPEFYLYANDYEFFTTIRLLYTRFQNQSLE